MEEEKTLVSEVVSEAYDTADRPFDFVEADTETALICESDPALREKISNAMKNLGYRTTEATSAKDALKNMRFHVYQVVILNENFDTSDQASNAVLNYLANLNMSTRRQIFVTLISSQFRTTDNMAAFNKSVNLLINTSNIDELDHIMKRGVAENDAFYHVFKETLRKKGRI
jgi:CheY-like chemotaxis protein